MPRTDQNVLLTLYKYRSLAPPLGRDAAENIILRNRLYWQSPLAFNDPFDCNPVLIFGTNEASRVAYAKRAVSNNFPNLSRGERREKVRELLRVRPRAREHEMRDGFREWMSESAVTCFSQVGDSALMWAHYADSHRGVCFIFQELMQPRPWFAFDVSYSEDRPRIDYTQDVSAIIDQGVLNKSWDWKYEQECRMIEYRRAPGFRSFPNQALTGVIYGARISDEDREFMDELVQGRAAALKRYQARLDDDFFRVNVEEA